MFAIGIRYLNGWAMAASDGAKKEQAEWPPHPDRVFMALAAAYFDSDRADDERAALEWLEALQPAPSLTASAVEFRRVVTHYVPVNDTTAPSIDLNKPEKISAAQVKDGLSLLPESRSRQPRQFPVAIPHDDTVYLAWPLAEPAPEVLRGMNKLCRKLTSIGHSASLAQAWVEETPPPPTLTPAPYARAYRLRISGAGRLQTLERDYNGVARLEWAQLRQVISASKGTTQKRLKGELAERFGDDEPTSRRPSPSLWMSYAPVVAASTSPVPHQGIFSDQLLIFRQISGRRLGLESTLLLTEALRNVVMKNCIVQPPPEWVSGHAEDGQPSKVPHLACFPLANVGNDHAQGHLMGVAIAVPATVTQEEVGRSLASLFDLDENGEAKPLSLYCGDLFEVEVQLELAENSPVALQSNTWIGDTKDERQWASVTPIVLDRHGKGMDAWEQAEESIKLACERAGLPRPKTVVMTPASPFSGAPHKNRYPYLLRKAGGKRHHTHAFLIFDEPVRGPIIIGAGRFRGYGLCRPWPSYSHSGRGQM